MEFQKVLETRRSVRKYDPNVSVTREQMEELIRAAQEAPSWKNSQTGRYYCVLSEEIADKIRETCLPQARNVWGRYSLGLQNPNPILNSTALGLSTLIMGLRESDKLREILSIPETESVVAVIAVGKATEEPTRKPRKSLDEIAKFF